MPKKIKRELECLLGPEELGRKGIEACEKRDKAREHKEAASALEKEAKELEHQVATKKVKRMVECIEDKDFAKNAIIVTRTDAPENWPEGTAIVDTRAMTGDERQTMIDIGDDGSKDDDKPAKKTTKAPAKHSKKSAPN